MKEWITHSDTLTQVKVPLPFPLRWVNSYLIQGYTGYTLIDPGLHTPDAIDLWNKVMTELKISFTEIKQIILTHHHPDHYGLAGWFQEQTQAPVYMSKISHDQAVALWGEGSTMNNDLQLLFEKHGMDNETLEEMRVHLESFLPLVSPQPSVDYIVPGETIKLGDQDYTMITASGHAMGQLCFYNKEHQEIFCGDQVIPQISPNISYLPGGMDTNPLATFLTSLQELSQFPVKIAYPGHREPFHTFAARADEIVAHHHTRLTRILELMNSHSIITVYGLCRSMFGENLSIHQLRFAMAETLAHVIYLQIEGRVREQEQDGLVTYSLS